MLALLLAATLTFDFPSVHIGIAEYESGPTGATVFYFPTPVMVAVDVRGGSPATINTDFDLGRAPLRNARPNVFELGARGAGRFAMQSGYFGDAARTYSGQGAAFRQLGNVKVAVFMIVNPLGAVVNRDGTIARCAAPPCGTITNQKLPVWALQRLAVQVHTSMARAIQPFHTTRDGDVLFAASTGEVENDKLSVADLGVIASEVAWDAVLSSVPPIPRTRGRSSNSMKPRSNATSAGWPRSRVKARSCRSR